LRKPARTTAFLLFLALVAALAAAPSASASNLLSNGSFETTGSSWLSPWYFSVKSGGGGSISQTSATKTDGSYSALASITQASTSSPWVVQLSQSNLAFTSGRTYTVSFAAKADIARAIEVTLQKTGSPYTVYSTRQVALGTGWQNFSFTYQAAATDSVSLHFNLAAATGKVWLDNVAVVPPPPAGTVTLTPVADSYVYSSYPSTNYGTSTVLRSKGSPAVASYMKFDLRSLAAKTITSAKLRMKVTNTSADKHAVRFASDTSWSESAITWNNRPALGPAARKFTATAGTWVELDLTAALAGRAGQIVTLGVDSAGTDALSFYSREAATDKVNLVIEERDASTGKGAALRGFAAYWGTNTVGIDSDFADMLAGDMRWARVDLSWSTTPIAAFDAVVQTAQARGIKLVAVIHKTPPTNDLGTTADRSAFKSWLASMVNRYKYYVKYWEILNEPNLSNEWNIDNSVGSDQTAYADSVKRYVEVLKDGYNTVKANDSSAKVLFGGLSESTVERYMDVLLTTDAYKYFDIMSFHPYGSSPSRVLSRFNAFKAKMTSKSSYAVKPIWVTETGFNTTWTDKAGYVSSEQQKADYLTETMHLLYGAGAQLPIFWYTLHENGGSSGYGLELKDPTTLGTQYFPAFYAYRDLSF
jgi:Carbohydrate binding domain/Cellulase (glycosyl hydrolase family 5)